MKDATRRSVRLLLAFATCAALAAVVAGGAASSSTAALEDGTLQTLDQTGGAVMLELAGQPSALAYVDARQLGASKADAGKAGKAAKAANEQAQAGVLAA